MRFARSVAFMVGRIVYRGWAVAVLWTWHVTPLGVPRLGLAGGVGVLMVANIILPPSSPPPTFLAGEETPPTPTSTDVRVFVWVVAWTTLGLILGAIVELLK